MEISTLAHITLTILTRNAGIVYHVKSQYLLVEEVATGASLSETHQTLALWGPSQIQRH